MKSQPEQLIVEVDAFRVAKEQVLLRAELQAALTVCIFDETQAAGGMIHLRYVAPTNDQPLELTDNTLSSDLLLLDRFCKELRRLGARKHSWRVQVFAHVPGEPKMEEYAATVLDLIKAYFSDGRWPLECQEIRRDAAVVVRFNPREGRYWVHGSTGASSPQPQVVPVRA